MELKRRGSEDKESVANLPFEVLYVISLVTKLTGDTSQRLYHVGCHFQRRLPLTPPSVSMRSKFLCMRNVHSGLPLHTLHLSSEHMYTIHKVTY